MKNKYLFLIFLLILFPSFINAEETYYQTITSSAIIKDLASTQNSIYALAESSSSSIIYKYDMTYEEKGSKTFSELF